MSASFWIGFFRDAGIPYSLAKSYAATFEENRIGKDMLLDLDKGILADMGIKVMGDVIGILKHAKKEARRDSASVAVSGTSSKHAPKSASAVHSTQSAPQAPAVSTTSSPRQEHSDEEEFMGEAELIEYQEREPQSLPLEEHGLQPAVETEYGALGSELIQQVVAAVAQQQAQQQLEEGIEEEGEGEGEGELVNPAIMGLQDEFEEEYVTEAYKRQQQKRVLGTLYSDTVFSEQPQPKQPRLIILPQEDANEVGGVSEDPEMMANAPVSIETSSRRILEAAGLVKRGEHIHLPLPDKTGVSSSLSVFSRLDGSDNISPARSYHTLQPPSSPPSSSSAVTQPAKRTVVSAVSPSPTKLGLQITSKDGRRVSSAARGSSGSGGGLKAGGTGGSRESGATAVARKTKRETGGGSSGGLVSSSSSFAAKEPIKNRLGMKSGRGERYGGSEAEWPDTVSTSIASLGSGGRVSTRLGGSGNTRRESGVAGRRPHPTMVADSATNPSPKASSRLGGGHKSMMRSLSSSGVVSSATRPRSLQRRGGRTPPATMKADEYEIKRQLDIRSRLAAREKEVKERRSGPLRGRLGQHHVFQRLT